MEAGKRPLASDTARAENSDLSSKQNTSMYCISGTLTELAYRARRAVH